MEKDDLDIVTENRREIFRLKWFKDLLRGQLGLGDTFWVGNFGALLIFAPIGFLIAVVLLGFDGTAQFLMLGIAVFGVVLAVYYTLLTRAVFKAALRTPQVGGWRWVGVVYTAFQAVALFAFAVPLIVLS